MTVRRLDAGPLLALAGSLLLLVSLFLDWYEPGVNAWAIFEVLDLVLAALAVAGVLAALALIGATVPAPDSRWLPWLSGVALVIVVVTLLDPPPAVGDGDPETGVWLALAGAAAMAAGALLAITRISVSFNVQTRRTRVAAVDARGGHEPHGTMPGEPFGAPEPFAAPADEPFATPAPETPAAAPRSRPKRRSEPEPDAVQPAPDVAVAPSSDPLVPPLENPPEPPAELAPEPKDEPRSGEEATRKMPDLTKSEDATGTRVEETHARRATRRPR